MNKVFKLSFKDFLFNVILSIFYLLKKEFLYLKHSE